VHRAWQPRRAGKLSLRQAGERLRLEDAVFYRDPPAPVIGDTLYHEVVERYRVN
jgi:hypothetical protein